MVTCARSLQGGASARGQQLFAVHVHRQRELSILFYRHEGPHACGEVRVSNPLPLPRSMVRANCHVYDCVCVVCGRPTARASSPFGALAAAAILEGGDQGQPGGPPPDFAPRPSGFSSSPTYLPRTPLPLPPLAHHHHDHQKGPRIRAADGKWGWRTSAFAAAPSAGGAQRERARGSGWCPLAVVGVRPGAAVRRLPQLPQGDEVGPSPFIL